MSAVLLPSGAETVGKPCPTCGGDGIMVRPTELEAVLIPCRNCSGEGVVRERYVVAKAEREWFEPTQLGWTPERMCPTWRRADVDTEWRTTPVEPLGETDWYIASEQCLWNDSAWLPLIAAEDHDEYELPSQTSYRHVVKFAADWWELRHPGYAPAVRRGPFETRFAITHVAHNVRELPVVAYEEMEPPDSYLRPYRDGSLVAIGGDRSGPTDITDEPWASDLAPGDLVLEFTEPPVLLDEPIVEMLVPSTDVYVTMPKDRGELRAARIRVPLVLALGVNRIELP